MNVLFKSIPIESGADELAEFIESAIYKCDLEGHQLHISVTNIELLEIQDCYTHPIERFGVVRISPSDIAKKIIKELDGHDFNEHHITVREFFDRSRDNDPRSKNASSTQNILEKRVKDRREQRLKYSRLI
jgi:hypothetical protein